MFASEEVIFAPETKTTTMYFVKRGLLSYDACGARDSIAANLDMIRAAYLNDRMDDDADSFGVDTWINEPALWLDWMTCGSLIAVASSDVVTLNVETFHLVIKDFAVSKRVFQRYARAS